MSRGFGGSLTRRAPAVALAAVASVLGCGQDRADDGMAEMSAMLDEGVGEARGYQEFAETVCLTSYFAGFGIGTHAVTAHDAGVWVSLYPGATGTCCPYRCN